VTVESSTGFCPEKRKNSASLSGEECQTIVGSAAMDKVHDVAESLRRDGFRWSSVWLTLCKSRSPVAAPILENNGMGGRKRKILSG
jgi:hypothetical protein